MKSIKHILAAITLIILCSSCLKSHLETLDTYKGNDITGAFVYYRYIDQSTTIPASGQNAVKQTALKVVKDINAESKTCDLTVSIPSSFPAAEVANVSAGALVVALNVSTAAVVTPVGDAPKLGVPADWSKPHQYEIMAADGNAVKWTITVSLVK